MQDTGGFLRGYPGRWLADEPGFGIIDGHFDAKPIFHQRPASVDLLPRARDGVPDAGGIGTAIVTRHGKLGLQRLVIQILREQRVSSWPVASNVRREILGIAIRKLKNGGKVDGICPPLALRQAPVAVAAFVGDIVAILGSSRSS